MHEEIIQELTPNDAAFPTTLNAVNVASLFVRGALPQTTKPMLAVVGTRSSTPEGERITKMLVEPIARAGVVIISGLAEGIDTFAHQAALDAAGKTIAVLGTGVDSRTLYPQRNVPLANNIVQHNGAIISEYAPSTPGRKHHFPQRNRIIAALADITLVIEAPQRSGALITANHAERLGRAIAAVPGALNNPIAAGCNALLEKGAHAIASPEHLADLLGITLTTQQNLYTPQSSEERELLSLLQEGPQGVDTILNRCTMSTPKTLEHLSRLEQQKIIEEVGAKHYLLKCQISKSK